MAGGHPGINFFLQLSTQKSDISRLATKGNPAASVPGSIEPEVNHGTNPQRDFGVGSSSSDIDTLSRLERWQTLSGLPLCALQLM